MNDKQMMTGIIIYLILSSIDRTEPHGKRGRKAIMQKVKKQLAIHGKKDRDNYLAMVADADVVMESAREQMSKDNFLINPGAIISTMVFKYEECVEPFGLTADHIANLKDAYAHSRAGFRSIQIANRIMDSIDEYLKEKK